MAGTCPGFFPEKIGAIKWPELAQDMWPILTM
jgi:hypothetical protein